MTEIKNIISELKKNNKKEEAFFGFYHQEGDENNTCIKANKQGLELFSAELLKARLEIEKRKFENGEVEYAELEIDWTNSNADFYFDNVELTSKIKTKKENSFPEYKETWKDKFYGYLIFGIIISLVIIFIIGFVTTIKWIF
ncbi:hypothetical protein [uncultured Tenacibaculum sp.]|uniref:hypothetical protein n=1 Tax=uncultured Tenacibaculum sp. TaxID=174713 RepID=UPI0026089662|nr:hypothetical protein [uncultured Tenacibaculum sp.]